MRIEDGLIAKDALTKRTAGVIIRNTGKLVALVTALIAIIVSFTDVSFASVTARTLTGNLLLMLICAYLIYFSLEDAGEKLGEDTDAYRDAMAAYRESRDRIGGEDVGALREFCREYSARELEYRRQCALMSEGLTREELESYLSGARGEKRKRRALRRIARMRMHSITPSDLLGGDRERKGELSDPTHLKNLKLALKLLPTAIFMCLTVSFALTAKDGLTAETVLESVVRLCTLPIVGFRGYSAGYSYVREGLLPRINTKKRILDAFLMQANEH